MATYGMRLQDLFGQTKALFGQIDPNGDPGDSSNYGIALVNPAGQLTKIHDFLFGPTADYDTTADALPAASTAWVALGGPVRDVVVGQTGRLKITVGCQIDATQEAGAGVKGWGARMAVELSGANTLAASPQHAFVGRAAATVTAGTAFSGIWRSSYTHFFTGLTPGLTTVTAMYSKTDAACDASVADRSLIIEPY